MEFQSQISLDLLSNSTKILEIFFSVKTRNQESTLYLKHFGKLGWSSDKGGISALKMEFPPYDGTTNEVKCTMMMQKYDKQPLC